MNVRDEKDTVAGPYARKGALYDAFRDHYGKDDPCLVWKAPTRTMNPTISQRFIDREMEKDPASAAAEFLAEFRSDLESFVNREVIEAAVVPGRYELPPVSRTNYYAFVDPSGGSGADRFCLAISHQADGIAILDAVREVRPRFSPETVVGQFAELLDSYGIRKIEGDRFAGLWPVEAFRKHGIVFEQSARPKSDLYGDVLPLLNSRRVELLDHPRLVAQFSSLERRVARGGRDSIDHPPGGHDDVANSATGSLLLTSARTKGLTPELLEPGKIARLMTRASGRSELHRGVDQYQLGLQMFRGGRP